MDALMRCFPKLLPVGEPALTAVWHQADRANAALTEVNAAIFKATACTIAGLLVKARRVLWCRGGELHLDMVEPNDVGLAMSLVRDLVAMDH
jgi:hypothetical protein